MKLVLVSGSSHPQLSEAVAATLGVEVTPCKRERFPDGEIRVEVGAVGEGDVFILQPTGPPVNDNIIELLLLIDACRRQGAGRITAVVPYLGYARQDRRTASGQSLAAQVIANAITGSGVDRVVVVDSHTPTVESLFGVPVATLTAVGRLAGALEAVVDADAAILAPDLGAVKLAEAYGSLLGRPVVVVRKRRLSGTEVRVSEVVGEVAGRPVVIVDDMISTGSTIRAAAGAVLDRGALPDITVVATHGVFAGAGSETFPAARRVLVTDSLPQDRTPGIGVVSIAPLLADAIQRLHTGCSLDDILMRR